MATWTTPVSAQDNAKPQQLIARQKMVELERQIAVQNHAAAVSEAGAKNLYLQMENLYARVPEEQHDMLKPYVVQARNALVRTKTANNAKMNVLLQKLQLARLDMNADSCTETERQTRFASQQAEIAAQQSLADKVAYAAQHPTFDRYAALRGQ